MTPIIRRITKLSFANEWSDADVHLVVALSNDRKHRFQLGTTLPSNFQDTKVPRPAPISDTSKILSVTYSRVSRVFYLWQTAASISLCQFCGSIAKWAVCGRHWTFIIRMIRDVGDIEGKTLCHWYRFFLFPRSAAEKFSGWRTTDTVERMGLDNQNMRNILLCVYLYTLYTGYLT